MTLLGIIALVIGVLLSLIALILDLHEKMSEKEDK